MRFEWNDRKLRKTLKLVVEAKSLGIAKNIAIDARMLAPVDLGALVLSIEAVKSRFEGGGAIVLAGGGDEYYASFKELGTSKMAATPFLRPALEKNRDKAQQVIASGIRRELR